MARPPTDYRNISIMDRCVICGKQNPDKHHWKSRKSGGSDDSYNIVLLCRQHHQEFHRIGATSFATKYIQVSNWLVSNNWKFNELLKKWRRSD